MTVDGLDQSRGECLIIDSIPDLTTPFNRECIPGRFPRCNNCSVVLDVDKELVGAQKIPTGDCPHLHDESMDGKPCVRSDTVCDIALRGNKHNINPCHDRRIGRAEDKGKRRRGRDVIQAMVDEIDEKYGIPKFQRRTVNGRLLAVMYQDERVGERRKGKETIMDDYYHFDPSTTYFLAIRNPRKNRRESKGRRSDD